ncbi:uncharacterized protein EI90DRAFT_1573652 [Cantharellus anzutake]|uniref:uncharacterized protein n=1 Tax=Cantharellus anzutake TaxID=1750568 RepID=UPI001906A248|nr:uncharacterized protein EI90DRAFT_1573652 [Cantharellus anzutake]KAF8328413.1 hypothetical protein EI90DRAFT_1573652 [Cantharellus anzutake]
MSTESTSTKHHGSYESSNATALGSGSQEYSRNSSRGATASSERVKASWEDSQSSRAEGEDDILNGIPAKGDKGFNLSDFCFELDRSSRAERAVVTSIRRYATKGRVKHRFLLISVNLEADKFWFRLDRHPRTKSFLKLSSASYLASNDLVSSSFLLSHYHNLDLIRSGKRL